ncbi:MAG TPA: acylphosphatase [Paucimonas sp.]|nr:acylphosphatase [Paucimonas sp.]HJW54028.1 acylphosphatase [Burkholderiaceae bacterium]
MARHLLITGIVQGVGYRASFEREARALRLSGWVRNRADGAVEALVAGDPAALDRIIAWARRGPSGARVDRVTVAETGDDEATADFRVLPTL